MYGGVPSAVTGVFAIKLYILVNDYEKAYDIVCEYAKSKQEDFEKHSEQKGLGITILPKKQVEE